MRIAIVTEVAPPNVNGVVTRLGHTLRELRRHHDEVLVIAPSTAPAEWAGAAVERIGSVRLPRYPELAVAIPRPALGDAIARFRPDVIHAVNPVVLGAAAVLYGRVAGIPTLASYHTNVPRYLAHYGLGALEDLAWELVRTIHNQASATLCISTPVADELRLRGFERVEVDWQGGVDADLFHPRRASPAMRERLTAGHPQRPLILYAGRVSAEKGVDLLPSFTACLPDIHLAVVGDGPRRATLEAELAGRRATFTGYLRGAELASALATADVLLFPSATETLGLVALEAMAAGTPVVAASAGGIPSLVEHSHNGLLFAPGDVAAAATEVARLLRNPVEHQLMRVRAHRFAQSWTWRAAADGLRSRYAGLLAAGEQRAA